VTAPIRRAIVSVSDKRGVTDLAAALARAGVEIISTGGTARAIADAGIPVTPVERVTGLPEMLDGRVKTLHPAVHAGILAVRGDPEHQRAMHRHGFSPIDLVVIDLYPFEATIARPGVDDEEAIEQIDIGGPAMIRSAAKNHHAVTVVTDPADYPELLGELAALGGTSDMLRRRLAAKAFARTSAYDAAIAGYLSPDEALPERLTVSLRRAEMLRYGENPHQQAAVYRGGTDGGGVLGATLLHGKPLSYNNIADAAAAWALTESLARLDPRAACAAIVKHANPCGAAAGPTAALAIDAAFAGDPVAAYGGILGSSARIDAPAAERLSRESVFLEVLCAPAYDDDALTLLTARWKNLRILAVPPTTPTHRLIRTLPGGAIVQTPDAVTGDTSSWTAAAGDRPDDATLRAATLIEAIAAALSSNAVALGGFDRERPGVVRLFGAGAGQMDRLTACRLAVEKAGASARGAIAVSDAFFPFSDGPAILAEAGVAVIVHPGGSMRDEETFALCKERGIACVITGTRRFRHEPMR
jgi:phosphoribosylaminoimidazolecarboxamide formyltransferase/IMP cyclohydrolase